jgi:hypothetical protein
VQSILENSTILDPVALVRTLSEGIVDYSIEIRAVPDEDDAGAAHCLRTKSSVSQTASKLVLFP